jgi:hypothetical protein
VNLRPIVPAILGVFEIAAWVRPPMDGSRARITAIERQMEDQRIAPVSRMMRAVNDGRRPKPRPDVNRGEDPDRVFLAADDRPNLVGLKLREGKCNYFSIVEPTTRMGCLFEPSSDGIPGDLLYSGDRRLVQTLDAQCWQLRRRSRDGVAVDDKVCRLCRYRHSRHYAGSRTMPGDAIFAASNNRLL